MVLSDRQQEMCEESRWDFTDLKAQFLNCTLKPSPELAHIEGLMNVSKAIMEANGVTAEILRPVDFDIAPGVYPDMREHGAKVDEWPEIHAKVLDANILVIGTPIWLGDKSSVATRVIERLYSTSGVLNEAGQYACYGRAAGTLITGNEDGVKHLGYMIPPLADAGWIGEVGSGAS